MINHAIILAAGRGVRMMPLTKKIPKAMVKIKNQTLILKGIKKIQKHIKNIHITVGYKGSLIAKHVIKNNVRSVLNTNKFLAENILSSRPLNTNRSLSISICLPTY